MWTVREVAEEAHGCAGSSGGIAGGSWGGLHSIIKQASACVYTPLQFFVAWHGVITVAYTGTPPSVVEVS